MWMATQRWVVSGVSWPKQTIHSLAKKILQNVVAQGKKLRKAVYVFSVNAEGGKVGHANYVPEDVREKGFDARTWASKVTEVLGGKVRLSQGRVIAQIDDIFDLGWRERGWGSGCWCQHRGGRERCQDCAGGISV